MAYRWSVEDIIRQINMAVAECRHPQADGAWSVKQDLYQIKWFVDSALKKCPTFTPEKQWLENQEKKRIVEILKSD